MKKQWFVLLVFMFSIWGSSLVPPASAEAEDAVEGSVIITALQTSGTTEFVEIYNNSLVAINVEGWKVRYESAANTGTGSVKATITSTAADQSDTILAPGEFQVFATANYKALNPSLEALTMTSGLSDSGGHIILTDAKITDATILDRVNYGVLAVLPGVEPAAPHLSGQSLKRCVDQANNFVDSISNKADFVSVASPLHRQLGPRCPGMEDPAPDPEPQLTCEGIIINEILPNPAGSDTGREFIELYNPTDEVISLSGCSMQISSNSKKYEFGNSSLQPGQYLAIDDGLSGLTLPNASGGTVWLLSPGEELQSINYQANLDDDQSWGLFTAGWQATYQPTINEENVLIALKPCPAGQIRSSETGLCQTPESSDPDLVPCRADQERNPETNRCRLIQGAAAGLTACKPGQVRSLETNRCRSVLAASSNLVPCKPGQERNPETNRCRNAGSSDRELKPCAEGQERNPETNRCRKVAGASSSGANNIAAVKDVASGSIASNPRWMLAGLGVAGALGYAGFEWRREVLSFISKFRGSASP